MTQCLTADMVFQMKTTLNIDDTVMQRLREEAARRGTTMSALVEAGLRRILDECSESPPTSIRLLPPLPTRRSGGLLVDISNREELYRVLDQEMLVIDTNILVYADSRRFSTPLALPSTF